MPTHLGIVAARDVSSGGVARVTGEVVPGALSVPVVDGASERLRDARFAELAERCSGRRASVELPARAPTRTRPTRPEPRPPATSSKSRDNDTMAYFYPSEHGKV